MEKSQSTVPQSAWTEPDLPEARGLTGVGWLPEVLCGMALLPLIAMAVGVVTVPAAVAALASAGTLGVGVLALT
jgi:hypothetical protein